MSVADIYHVFAIDLRASQRDATEGEWVQAYFCAQELSYRNHLQKQANKMADSKDNLNWFLQHCTEFHYILETDVPTYDVALMIMKHIIGLNI
jgi:hypothetical protein